MTRTAFVWAYAERLVAQYPWAQEPDRLARFLDGVQCTLQGASTWNHDGPVVLAAWRAIGGKGRPSLKGLRGLPA